MVRSAPPARVSNHESPWRILRDAASRLLRMRPELGYVNLRPSPRLAETPLRSASPKSAGLDLEFGAVGFDQGLGQRQLTPLSDV